MMQLESTLEASIRPLRPSRKSPCGKRTYPSRVEALKERLAIMRHTGAMLQVVQCSGCGPSWHITFPEAIRFKDYEVLIFLARGHTPQEVAQYLGTTLKGVRRMLDKVRHNSGDLSRAQILSLAAWLGLLNEAFLPQGELHAPAVV